MSHENGHGPAVLEGLRTPSKALRSAIPDVYAGFSSMHRAALEPGTVDAKTKELIALGISVAQQCDGCIASHARGAAMKGATPEEVAETIGVAILMIGGPGTVYGPRAYDAFLEFHEKYAAKG
ncbi:carboxymuconolactone decarboxylase family protein [Fodinibacter luteus]|uniref:Carboxymuconolactone decarboxylase family protein n=1 Tax=Fodinibacter luteus TaxID=552064 RepID=A0ABP8K389_9MICO